MTQIIWGGSSSPEINDAIAHFVRSRIPGCERGFSNYTTMGVVADGSLIAGIVYHNWMPETGVIEFSGAAETPRWLTRPVLRAMFAYPFEQIGCQLAVARIDPDNKRLRRIFRSYGFAEYEIPRLRGRNKSEMICTLSDDAWRSNGFHEVDHG